MEEKQENIDQLEDVSKEFLDEIIHFLMNGIACPLFDYFGNYCNCFNNYFQNRVL